MDYVFQKIMILSSISKEHGPNNALANISNLIKYKTKLYTNKNRTVFIE